MLSDNNRSSYNHYVQKKKDIGRIVQIEYRKVRIISGRYKKLFQRNSEELTAKPVESYGISLLTSKKIKSFTYAAKLIKPCKETVAKCRENKGLKKHSRYPTDLVYRNTTVTKLATDVTNIKCAHRYVYIYLLHFIIRLILVI